MWQLQKHIALGTYMPVITHMLVTTSLEIMGKVTIMICDTYKTHDTYDNLLLWHTCYLGNMWYFMEISQAWEELHMSNMTWIAIMTHDY
jgi:hypothetical protein